jgi:hypothetical protein
MVVEESDGAVLLFSSSLLFAQHPLRAFSPLLLCYPLPVMMSVAL